MCFFTEEGKKPRESTFSSEWVRYHIDHVKNNNPERLQQLVDSGDILSYLTAIDDNVWSEIMRQKERWQLNNKEYLLAEANGDFVRQAALANMFVHSAKETIYPKMVYV